MKGSLKMIEKERTGEDERIGEEDVCVCVCMSACTHAGVFSEHHRGKPYL